MKISRERVVDVIDNEIKDLEERWRKCHKELLLDKADRTAERISALDLIKEKIQQLEDET